MKKALALLVAFATASTISITAYADGMPEGFTGAAGDTSGSGVGTFSLEWEDTTGYSIQANEMFFVYADGDKAGSILKPGSLVAPDEDYTLDVYYAKQDVSGTASPTSTSEGDILANSAPVTKAMLNGGRLRLRTVKGSNNVASAKLEERGNGNNATYRVSFNTKANYGTKINDVEYALEVTGGNNSPLVNRTGVAFRVGFPKYNEDTLNTHEEGDIVVIYNDAPVITKKMFENLAKNYNYRAVTFENEDATWTYTGRVSGMADTNFYNTQKIIPTVVMENPDVDFKFVNFHGGVKFPTNGEMRIDVSDISEDFGRMYVYLSRGGALTPVTTTHDRETDEIVFKTNYLGTFIIANEEIETAGSVTEPGTSEPDGQTPPTTTPPTTNPNNPGTGASTAMDLISAIGLTALSGSGLLLRKRK